MTTYNGIIKIAQENNIPNILVMNMVGTELVENQPYMLELNHAQWTEMGETVFKYFFEDLGMIYSHIDFDDRYVILKQYGEWDHKEHKFIPNSVISQSNEILKKCAII